MTEPTPQDFAYLLRMFENAFGTKIGPETADLFYRQFRKYPRIVLLRGFEHLINNSKYFPRLSEINQAVARFSGVYRQPDDIYSAFNEATIWYLNMADKRSVAELSETDIQAIHDDLAKHGYKIREIKSSIAGEGVVK